LRALLALEPSGPVVDPWALPGGWRIGAPAWTRWRVQATGHGPVEIRTRGRAEAAELALDEDPPIRGSARWDGGDLLATVDGITRRYSCAVEGPVVWLGRDGHSWELRERSALVDGRRATAGAGGAVRAPMPGTITTVDVAEGQQVTAGAPLLVLEAMKMEHTLTAPVTGVIRELKARPGDTVERDTVLLTLVSA
ncbi:MAG: biotin/lipoyl-containing protein, partial [Pseudonocardiaceae bacterium]